MSGVKKSARQYGMPPVSPGRVNKAVGNTGELPYIGHGGNIGRNGKQPVMRMKKPIPKRPTPDYSARMNIGAPVAGIPTVRKSETVLKRRTGAKSKPKKAKVKVRERLSKFDYPFFTIILVLLSFGIVMMFSASYAYSQSEYGDSYYLVTRQLGFAALGIPVMILLSFVDYHILWRRAVVIIGCGVSVALMVMVKLVGVTKGGAERWIEIGGVSVQPSEILKLAVVILLAYFAHKRADRIKELGYGYMPFLMCILIACTLTLIQPHLSGTIIIFAIGVTMMIVGNCRVRHIVTMFVVFAVLAAIGYLGLKALGYDYFDARFLSFNDPEADVLGATYQTYQSLVTIGSGGIFGLGLGNSRQKFSLLPATHNDFVFSVICEELGLVGAIFVILIFLLFVYRGFYIASRARDKFGMLVAVGITMQIGVQALLNIAVASNSVPNTGISLPFFSYGGTALLMQLAEMGIVLNISRKAAIE